MSIPAEDRIRIHNIQWRKRSYPQLKLIVGAQLLTKFASMAANFWPQKPEDSHRFFNLYLTDGKTNLDREAFAKLNTHIAFAGEETSFRIEFYSLFCQ